MSSAEQQSDKELDLALTAIQGKVQGVKNALTSFVGKIEHDHQLKWPSVLDSFASLSAHTSTLMKQLASDKIPPLHARVLLPLQVSSDRDSELERSTEGRVPIMHHEVVPQYLRTKLDLDLEARQRELVEEVRRKGDSLKEEIRQFNEMVSTALDRVGEAKEELEEQRAKAEVTQPNASAETKKLVAAYLHGQGLTPMRRSTGGRPRPGGIKAPSAMRTELKQMAAPYPTTSPHKTR